MPESMVKEIIPIIGKRYCFLRNRKILLESEKENSPFVDKVRIYFLQESISLFLFIKIEKQNFLTNTEMV